MATESISLQNSPILEKAAQHVLNSTKYAFLWFIGKHEKRTKPVPDIVRSFFILLSSFCTMTSINAVLEYGPVFKNKHSTLLPPWAATVILTNNYLESPFGQPLPLATGTIISAIIGTGLTKLFMLNPANEEYLWVCGVLAVAISSVIMGLTGTLHPAAASTALLCATSKEIREQLGWFYLVNQIVISIITIGIACLFGNMYSRYPLYWLLPPRLETPKSHRLFAPWLGSIFGCLFHQEKVDSSSSSDISSSSESKDSTDLSSFSSEGSNERGQYDEDLPVRDYGDYGDYTHTDYDEDDNTESGEEYTPAPAKPTN